MTCNVDQITFVEFFHYFIPWRKKFEARFKHRNPNYALTQYE